MNTPHLIEIALLMLAAFLIGCVIGYFLRKLVGGSSGAGTPSAQATAGEAEQTSPSAAPSSASASAASETTSTSSAAASKTVAEETKPVAAKKAAPKKAPAKASTAAKPASKAAAKPPAKKTKAASTATKAKSSTPAKKTAASKPAAKAETKPAAAKPATASADGKPATLSAPRDGGKDDLKNIKGVGPKIEGILNGMGIYHYDQIASWGRKEVKWVDEELSFKGRIDREKWIAQAKKLVKDAEK